MTTLYCKTCCQNTDFCVENANVRGFGYSVIRYNNCNVRQYHCDECQAVYALRGGRQLNNQNHMKNKHPTVVDVEPVYQQAAIPTPKEKFPVLRQRDNYDDESDDDDDDESEDEENHHQESNHEQLDDDSVLLLGGF